MKRLLLLVLLLTGFQGFSQTQGISYQAVILSPGDKELSGENAGGNVLANTAVSIQFTVVNSSAGEEFKEYHRTSTDRYGMINLLIGAGTTTGNANFTDIVWDGTIKKLKVGIDFTGGTNFSPLSEQNLTYMPQPVDGQTQQIIAGILVDQAILKQEIAEIQLLLGDQGIQGIAGLKSPVGSDGNGFRNGNAAGQMLYWNGRAWVLVAATANEGASLQMIDGVPTWVGGSLPLTAPGIDTATAVAKKEPTKPKKNPKLPDAPTIGTATGGDAQATVAFTAPKKKQKAGEEITGYTVTSSPDGKTASGGSSPITVTGLTNGTAYTFTVTAINSAGTGEASEPSNSVTPVSSATVPGAPTIGTATAGDAQATVAFTAPASDGGAAITTYTATSNPGNITGTVSQAGSGTITVTGLTNGTPYTFTVTATNSAGTGAASAASNSVTPVAPPPPPPSVTSSTGKIWMDRNLGATQVATSSTDGDSYGDLYQWGRGTDGHQSRTSATTTTRSSSDDPGDAYFIITNYQSPADWRSTSNNDLWQGVNGVNNPCPIGYRLPTEAEWLAETAVWSIQTDAGAFASVLKLPVAGRRNPGFGSLELVGERGNYWSSTVNGTNSVFLQFAFFFADPTTISRATGTSVRCIKD